MKSILISAACIAALVAHGSFAGEVTGGSLGLGYSAFTDTSAGTVNKTSLDASLEYGFNRDFGLQGDVSIGRFGWSDFDTSSVGLHAIYHVSENASLGAFAVHDVVNGAGQNFYGAEAGFEQGQIAGNVYAAAGSNSGVTGRLLGLGGTYHVSPGFSLGASYDRLDVSTLEASRLQLETEFHLDKVTLSAQLGSADVNNAGSETYFGLGAKVNFGAKRGATFEQRGLLAVLPGL